MQQCCDTVLKAHPHPDFQGCLWGGALKRKGALPFPPHPLCSWVPQAELGLLDKLGLLFRILHQAVLFCLASPLNERSIGGKEREEGGFNLLKASSLLLSLLVPFPSPEGHIWMGVF